MTRYYMILIVFLIVPLVQSCVATTVVKPVKRQDPLIGKIIESKTSQTIDFNHLIDTISNADVIYLSEKHDNPDQHAAQQKVIKALIKKLAPKKRKPSIGFEFFAMDNTPDLLNFIDAGKIKHNKKIDTMIEKSLRMKLGWHNNSDTMWKYYYDLLKTAQKNDLPVAGIDLSSTIKKRITKKGIKGITPLEQNLIFSTELSDTTYKTYMTDIFKAVHCGMGHERMQSRLYDTWVARNDKIAQSISKMHDHHVGPIVIIIGGGHTEHGLGVIDRVNAINPDISQVNISLTEISINPSELSQYLTPLDLDGYPATPGADFFWFFQRVSYGDPCEKFKEALKKMKKTPKD